MSLNWSVSPFERLYAAIQQGDLEVQQSLVSELQRDLSGLLVHPPKSAESRKKLESAKIAIAGVDYELNEHFVQAATRLSDELDLDEIAAAETLHFALSSSDKLSVQPVDLGKAAYHTRRLYLLQIAGYYTCKEGLTDAAATAARALYRASSFRPLDSFKQIEAELDLIKQQVERSRLLGTYADIQLQKSVNFCRDSLFNELQLLGEIFWGYAGLRQGSNSKPVLTLPAFTEMLTHVVAFQTDDIFALAYIPGFFRHLSSLADWSDADIETMHAAFLKDIADSDRLAESPLKALCIAVFLTAFFPWCKESSTRRAKFQFDTAVNEPLQKVIGLGAFEELLNICATSSLVDASVDSRIVPFYNFRPFLQQHIPRFSPIRLLDVDDAATNELKRSQGDSFNTQPVYLHSKEFPLNSHFTEFTAPVISRFAHSFIAHSAFMLTHLRDMEEDLLLSSELDLDAMAENADLERFYVALFYLYAERPALGAEYWEDKTSPSYGFLLWASRCNSPLIISTFCLLLSSLASGEQNATNTFNFLQLTNDNSNSHTEGTPSLMEKFTSVSWSTIYFSLEYYNKALSTPVTAQVGEPATTAAVALATSVTASLDEDSIIFISGFFQVISEVARNSSQKRTELFHNDDYQLLRILTDFLNNNTSLGGSAMTVLSSLVGDTSDDRKRIWQMLDNCMFRKQLNGHNINKRPQDVIKHNLTSFSSVYGFTCLVSELLRPIVSQEDPFDPMVPYFPLDLGSRIRKPGIWVYLEVLSSDIFVETMTSNIDSNRKASLQIAIVNLWKRCLEQLDPNLVLNASAAHLKDLDNVTSNRNIIQYLQANQGSAILCFLYRPQVNRALFQLCSLGIDSINELEEHSKKVVAVQRGLEVVNMVLEREIFFSDELLPILRLADNNFATPSDVDTCGMRSFYDALLLQLPLVAHISLYVSSTKLPLANVSLLLLKKISASSAFSSEEPNCNLLSHDRLLALYETVDESKRIKLAFIEQFEAPIAGPGSFGLKVDIMNLLLANLKDSRPTISHFLLGFDTKRLTLGSENEEGTIASEHSLFRSMLTVLIETASLIGTSVNIEFAPVRLCSMVMEIVLKLTGSIMFGARVLDFLRCGLGINVMIELLESAKKVYGDTLWCGKRFDEEFCINNKFVASGESTVDLVAFTSYRSSLLELLALELHSVSTEGSISLTDKYTSLLTNSSDHTTGSLKVLELLDVLEFQPRNMIENIDPLFSGFDYRYVFRRVTLKSEPLSDQKESAFNLDVVREMADLYGKESQTLGVLHKAEVKDNIALFEREEDQLRRILTCTISFDNFKIQDLAYLHAWVLLVQVIVSDGHLSETRRDNFILEVFQYIVPKIDDYLQVDMSYSEDLVSLCVSLLKLYGAGVKRPEAKALLDANRLFPVFKMAINGVLLPQSTTALRSDFYVLSNCYIQQAMASKQVLTELMIYIRSVDQRLFQTLCNDSLVGDGACRISALLLLDSMVKVTIELQQSSTLEGNFLMDTLCKSNYLYMLVQKLKSMDDVLYSCLDESKDQKVTYPQFMYELTAGKTSLYLMLRIAETRYGAQHLMNNDVFKTIEECKFLALDPDFEFDLSLQEYSSGGESGQKYVRLRMSLGSSDGSAGSGSSDPKAFSYYEVFVPVFQLVNAIVISLGPQNENSIKQAARLEKHFSKLITAVLKREIILEDRAEKNKERQAIMGDKPVQEERTSLKELSSLFMLLDSLV